MRHRLFIHLVWTTRDRQRLIDHRIARFLRIFLANTARQERAALIELGMVQTHVHLIVRINPATVIPRMVQRMKGASGMIANRDHIAPKEMPLKWEKGYNIESVSKRLLKELREYVRGQPTHHPGEAIPEDPPRES